MVACDGTGTCRVCKLDVDPHVALVGWTVGNLWWRVRTAWYGKGKRWVVLGGGGVGQFFF